MKNQGSGWSTYRSFFFWHTISSCSMQCSPACFSLAYLDARLVIVLFGACKENVQTATFLAAGIKWRDNSHVPPGNNNILVSSDGCHGINSCGTVTPTAGKSVTLQVQSSRSVCTPECAHCAHMERRRQTSRIFFRNLLLFFRKTEPVESFLENLLWTLNTAVSGNSWADFFWRSLSHKRRSVKTLTVCAAQFWHEASS